MKEIGLPLLLLTALASPALLQTVSQTALAALLH